MQKRIMVDMSATIIHHGHIRLLRQAAKLGYVVVGLTSDDQILKTKGYQSELNFAQRKEIIESIKYVDEVVSVPWLISDAILDQHKIDLLVHGQDNLNNIAPNRLHIVAKTKNISSTEIRYKVQRSITAINNRKLMLTPGPAVILPENLRYLKPVFGRGDAEYTSMAENVTNWIKDISGQDHLVMAQGSATFALELAAHTFIAGKVLLISTGYYSDRLKQLSPLECEFVVCRYDDLHNMRGRFDWVMCAYTETSTAFRLDLSSVRAKANQLGAKLYVDATGSIGLENNHQLADLMAFSSCKGLFGLTGGAFVAYKDGLRQVRSNSFYCNLETQQNKMTTGPYHAISSLYGVMHEHHIFKKRVEASKSLIMKKWHNLVRSDSQPLLCTHIRGRIVPRDDNVVLYKPRSELGGSIICHLGEIHDNKLNIASRISIDQC